MSRRRTAKDDRQPCTQRGQETLETLLGSAGEVFAERGYEAASVSAICRRARLAQGTFYLYFSGKGDVYVHLVERLQGQIVALLQGTAQGKSQAIERLRGACDTLFDFVSDNVGLFQVFREAEFVRPEIPKRFYATVCAEIRRVLEIGMRGQSPEALHAELVAYAILGMVFFLALRYVFWGAGELPGSVRQMAFDLVMRGIDSGMPPLTLPALLALGGSDSQTGALLEPAASQGSEGTREALLAAAERAFGEGGFHGTSVSTITYLAGVGQGTFYLHFPSKVALFNELVAEIGRRFRQGQRHAVADLADRRLVEVVGLRSFFSWIREHPGAYRIIREAEFVDVGVGRRYYERLAAGYARGLAAGMEQGQIRPGDAEALSYALLGMAHLSGQRWVLWQEAEGDLSDVPCALARFVLWGLAGEAKRTHT